MTVVTPALAGVGGYPDDRGKMVAATPVGISLR